MNKKVKTWSGYATVYKPTKHNSMRNGLRLLPSLFINHSGRDGTFGGLEKTVKDAKCFIYPPNDDDMWKDCYVVHVTVKLIEKLKGQIN